MSESEEQNTENEEEKKKSPIAVIFVILALLAIVLGVGVINKSKDKGSEKADSLETAAATITETGQESEISAPSELQETSKEAKDATTEQQLETANIEGNEANSNDAATATASNTDFDVEKAATPRILGNPQAPIKIVEYSSFTCGHCANFHKTNFKQIKEDYVDTGKAYIVFDDFPRNQHDLFIGAASRCVSDDAYFNFIQLVFESQNEWMKNDDYVSFLKQNAKLTGASEEQIDNCLNSTELHKKMAERRDIAMKDHNVNSTPTIVINDSIVMPGLSAYDKIKEVLDAELAKIKE